MKRFAALLDAILLTPSRNQKLAQIVRYFREAPDPDRGYALAVLTGSLSFANVKASLLTEIVLTKVDPVLFAMSYDYVGDLAETIALIWPEKRDGSLPTLSGLIQELESVDKAKLPCFARSCVSGSKRLPFPPASTNATILSRIAGLLVRARPGAENQDRGQCRSDSSINPMSWNNCFPRILRAVAALMQILDTLRYQFTFLEHHSRFTHRQEYVNSVYMRWSPRPQPPDVSLSRRMSLLICGMRLERSLGFP